MYIVLFNFFWGGRRKQMEGTERKLRFELWRIRTKRSVDELAGKMADLFIGTWFNLFDSLIVWPAAIRAHEKNKRILADFETMLSEWAKTNDFSLKFDVEMGYDHFVNYGYCCCWVVEGEKLRTRVKWVVDDFNRKWKGVMEMEYAVEEDKIVVLLGKRKKK